MPTVRLKFLKTDPPAARPWAIELPREGGPSQFFRRVVFKGYAETVFMPDMYGNQGFVEATGQLEVDEATGTLTITADEPF